MATAQPTLARHDASRCLPNPTPTAGHGIGVALLNPSAALPPPWCIDPSWPACDLCSRPSDELWPLAGEPGEDDIPAGELIICRACADSVRPVHHSVIRDRAALTMPADGARATCSTHGASVWEKR